MLHDVGPRGELETIQTGKFAPQSAQYRVPFSDFEREYGPDHASEMRPSELHAYSNLSQKESLSSQKTAPQTPGKPLFAICDGRIKIIEMLGQGAYGEVYRGEEEGKGAVAVKRIKGVRGRGWQGLSQTTLREISLLKTLTHRNVVQLREVVVEQSQPDGIKFHDVDETAEGMAIMYLVFEMGFTDLNKELRRSYFLTGGGLPHARVKSIMFQLLEGITFLHSNRVFHRDLKPENILLTQDDRVVICDLGLSRTVHMPLRPYSQEILTMCYRAPEMCVTNREYSVGVDSWSIGCIFVELITSKPLFPTDMATELLTMIVKLLGNPYHPENPSMKADTPFPSQLAPLLKLMGRPYYPGHPSAPIQKLAAYFPEAERKHGFNLLLRLLDINAFSRISPPEALQHPYFSSQKRS